MQELPDWMQDQATNEAKPLVQGTEAWLRWRGKGLGSSDAAVLLGWSPWREATELFGEKRGTFKPTFGFHQQRAMDRGKRLEPLIRKWYETQSGGAPFTEGTAEDSDSPFMRASFDGINHALRRIIEIKAPNASDHHLAKEGFVPEKYVPQVQWLLMLSGYSHCDYVSYGSDDTYAILPVGTDPAMQKELRFRAMIFWEHVNNPLVQSLNDWYPKWIHPGNAVALDLIESEEIITITEQETEALVIEGLKAKDVLDAAQARFDGLKSELKKKLGKASRAICGEAILEWQERKGNVDYGSIPELAGVDLERYRKDPIKAFIFKRKPE